MNRRHFNQQLEAARRHIEGLRAPAGGAPAQRASRGKVLTELSAAVEEMHRSVEELRAGRDELIAERAAVEAERQRYQDLFAGAPDGYLITSDAGVIEEANRAAAKLLRQTLDDLAGTPLSLFVAEEQRQVFHTRLDQLQSGRSDRLEDWEVCIRRRDGTTADVDLTAEVVRGSEGQLTGARWLLRDITRRKRAADALEEVAARTRAIVETAVDGIITIDALGTIQSFNPAAERLFGYRAGEVIGQSIRMLMPSPYQEEHDSYLARYLDSGVRKIIGIGRETVGQRQDGSTFPMNLAVSETQLRDGRIFTGIVHDITERHRGERRLAAQYAVTRVLAESVTVAEAVPQLLRAIGEGGGWQVGEMWSVDADADRLCWGGSWSDPALDTRAFEAVSRARSFAPGTGLPGRVWASGQPQWLTDLVTEAGFARLEAAHTVGLRAAFGFPIRHAGTVTGVMVFLSRDAHEFDDDLLTMVDAFGSQIGDFLARKRAEEALEQSEERYRHLVELSPDAILVNRDNRFVFANGAALRLWGATRAEEILGKSPFEIFHPDSHPAIRQRVNELLTGVPAVPFMEEKIVRLDETPVDVEVAAAAFSDDSGTAIQVVLRDISERKRAETQLRELEQLAQQRERLADIGAITAQIVHDLGNPLAAVSMHAQLILRRAQRGGDQPVSTVLKPAERIVGEVHRLAELVKEFMEFSREQRLDLKPVDLRPFLTRVVDLWRPLAAARAIDLSLSTPVGGLPSVIADEEKLHRIFENLVKNAVEAIERGPACIAISVAPLDNDKVRVSVEDSGPGISESVEVFRLFETTKPQGSGLGLAIVKQIVMAHRGGIGFAAVVPHGTVFHVDLRIRGPFG